MMTLYCATTNAGKLREFRGAAPDDIVIELLPGLSDIAPPDETGSTFEENATLKAVYYGAHTGGWLFAEDSGIEVDALGGVPGVWSARFAGPHATDDDNNQKLIASLESSTDRTARYVCVIALVQGGRLERTFRRTVEGEITRAPRGTNGFGYDPYFFYSPFGCTFGEASTEQKQSVSHRGAAFRSMLGWLRSAPV